MFLLSVNDTVTSTAAASFITPPPPPSSTVASNTPTTTTQSPVPAPQPDLRLTDRSSSSAIVVGITATGLLLALTLAGIKWWRRQRAMQRERALEAARRQSALHGAAAAAFLQMPAREYNEGPDDDGNRYVAVDAPSVRSDERRTPRSGGHSGSSRRTQSGDDYRSSRSDDYRSWRSDDRSIVVL